MICLSFSLHFFTVDVNDGVVADLTADNFKSFISENGPALVEFFAPWCGHCKVRFGVFCVVLFCVVAITLRFYLLFPFVFIFFYFSRFDTYPCIEIPLFFLFLISFAQALAPEFDKAAKDLAGKHMIAKVDCTEHRDLCSEYGVRGFPTLKMVSADGTTTEYNDARKADAITRWVIKQNSPAYVVVKTDAEVAEAKAKSGADRQFVLVTSSETSPAAVEFIKVSNALRDSADFIIQVVDGAKDTVTLFRTFDEPEVPYKGDVNAEALTTFAKRESVPLFGEIGPQTFQKYVERDLPIVWAFIDYTDDAQAAYPETLKEVAREFRDKVIFAKLDGKRWGEHAKTFGLASATPGFVIEDRKNRKNYVLAKEITPENVAAHVKAFSSGTLEPTLRSQEIPATNDGPVKVVVGKSFDDIVMDEGKDVLVAVTASYCVHCKNLVPIYEELAKSLADNENIVIAKVDGTENDTPIDVRGFPTIYFYPATKEGKSKPIQYSGARTVEGFTEFLKEHGKAAPSKPKHDEL